MHARMMFKVHSQTTVFFLGSANVIQGKALREDTKKNLKLSSLPFAALSLVLLITSESANAPKKFPESRLQESIHLSGKWYDAENQTLDIFFLAIRTFEASLGMTKRGV